ncbi:MAG: LysM peptidoglycan-binding domain-containing protein [Oscillospiraceae bacterium]|jgi:LysM repeat protein|nr:LysM peptidoglycan-binding domain-containing protein [Oscillospiraceae bacterium]
MSELFSANTPEDFDNTEALYASASPCGPGTVRYAIGQGETLVGIAKKFGTTVEEIVSANPKLNPQKYYAGDTICVPDGPYCKGTVHTIVKGDTFFTIAQKAGVSVDEMLAANPGVAPDKLVIGQTVCIPKISTAPAQPTCSGVPYTIRRGDTFYAIAQWNKIAMSDLIAANPGVSPEKLYVGQEICIPKAAAKPPEKPADPVCDGRKYQVLRGDTFYLIAQKNKTTIEALQKANPTVKPDQLTIGQIICIPTVSAPAPLCTGTKYTIQRGDTFFAIAKLNQLELSALIAANPSVNPEQLYIGQVICVPKKEAPSAPTSCDGTKYTISRGDTFFAIAQKNGVGIAELLAANPSVNPEKLFIGQVICVPKKSTAAPEPACVGTRYTIIKGDTFYEIAHKHGITIQDLLTANPGVNPERLYVGQLICIPQKIEQPPAPTAPPAPACDGTKYVVVKGDTFWGISQKVGIELPDLLAANPGIVPEKLIVGQILCVPKKAVPPFAPTIAPAPAPAPSPTKCSGTKYIVQKGDTFFLLAQKNGVDLTDLLAANPGVNPEKLEVGAAICIPKKPDDKPVDKPCNGVRYAVQKGDTFYAVAQWNNIDLADLLAANPGVNPEKLEVGQVICVPLKSGESTPGCNGNIYEVQKGDTLFAIAKRNSIPINDLLVANPGIVPEKMSAGQAICIPGGGGVSPFCANGAPYSIRKGDTLYAIAIRFGIPLARVLEANPDINPEKLIEGDLICLPDPDSNTPEPLCPNGTPYTIQKGETFYTLSLRYGIPLADVLAANAKVNPDALEPGDVICLPVAGPLKPFCETGTPHEIVKGDTLSAIALKYGISLEELMKANPSAKPDKLEIGSFLCVPKKKTPPAPPAPPVCDGNKYVIQKGDTFFALAQKYGVELADLITANPGVNPEKLEPGDIICIPKKTDAAPNPPPCSGNKYVIQKGDTFYSISQKFDIALADLLAANPGMNPEKLEPGDIICVPKKSGAASPPSCEGAKYVIKKGDTFYNIAQNFSLTVDALRKANPTVDPDNLQIGQIICLPKPGDSKPPAEPVKPCKPCVYIVQCGDTLFSIAKKFAVTLADLFAANPGLRPDCLLEGANVAIPCAAKQPDPIPDPPKPQYCPSGSTYTVQRGDSFYLIARRYGFNLADLLAANPGIAPDKLLVGQVICLPQATRKCADGYTAHTLSTGQTYADLLVLYNLSYSALELANPDINISQLGAGQTVCIPPSGNRGKCGDGALEPHVMVKGETLVSIAAQYNTTPAAILAANPNLAPTDFVTGRIICLPKDAKLG